MEPLKTFIIYASADDELCAKLVNHLSPLVYNGTIEIWSKKAVVPGESWNDTIKQQLEVAEVFLILVSDDFFVVPYVNEREFKMAIARLGAGISIVIPIIVRPCLWEEISIFRDLNVLPSEGKAVTGWDNADMAWRDVAIGVAQCARKLLSDREKIKERKSLLRTPNANAKASEYTRAFKSKSRKK